MGGTGEGSMKGKRCDFCPGKVGKSYRSVSYWVTQIARADCDRSLPGWLTVKYACHKKQCRLALRRLARKEYNQRETNYD